MKIYQLRIKNVRRSTLWRISRGYRSKLSRRCTSARKLQSNASYVSFTPRSHPLRPRWTWYSSFFFLAILPPLASSGRARDNLRLECVFHRGIVTQHAYAAVGFFGNSPRNRRSLTLTLGASPNQLSCHFLGLCAHEITSSNIYKVLIFEEENKVLFMNFQDCEDIYKSLFFVSFSRNFI